MKEKLLPVNEQLPQPQNCQKLDAKVGGQGVFFFIELEDLKT